jgi:hypothetical protein
MPRPRRSLLGKLAVAVTARQRTRSGAGRIAAAAAKAREHVVTFAALASVDLGAFHAPLHLGGFAGWIVTGASLLALDFAVRG